MTTPRRRIARRHDTRASVPAVGRLTTRMPDEFLSEQARRLVVFAGVAAGVWGFALLLDMVLLPPSVHVDGMRNWRAIPIEATSIGMSIAVWLYMRFSGSPPAARANLGLAFMLANAAAIAALNAWAMPLPGPGDFHLSWMAVLILVYSMIAPTTPRRMLVAALAAASMDPLAFAVAHQLGAPTPAPLTVAVMAWPNFACAVIAMLPSRVAQRMGRRLHEAQEMGSYQLIDLLGTGGMGEVWRAEHRLLARSAAIKLVRPEVLGARTDGEARLALRRFEREAQATAQLSSPHTIQVFDFGVTEDGTFYYVMELLSGLDLESMVREFGPMPAERAVHLLRQVCHSLADAHARGFVHRDIKPANIYVCRMGLEYDFVKVLDFGLVKFHQRGGDTLATLDRTTTGTPAYMAPETILGDVEVDRRADVYALGCVAYYLLTGQIVFEAETPAKMLMQHIHAQPVPPSQRTELPIPRELDELVMACLQKDPNRRPQNAEELFRLACACRTYEGWTQERARTWWEMHMREFTGPLAIGEIPEAGWSERTRPTKVVV
ncbi:MAG: serine/threonine protein kinase [Acidobacteria bacterium]|nr:serine/threonine protein kinase [Acidobacteriota bacterium]